SHVRLHLLRTTLRGDPCGEPASRTAGHFLLQRRTLPGPGFPFGSDALEFSASGMIWSGKPATFCCADLPVRDHAQNGKKPVSRRPFSGPRERGSPDFPPANAGTGERRTARRDHNAAYFSSTLAPAASSWALIFSASALATASLTGFGAA